MRIWPLLFVIGAFIISCKTGDMQSTETVPGIEVGFMDTTVSPSDDFYKFVNGGWLEEVEIPADRGRWGSFDELRKRTSNNMLSVLNAAIESGDYEAGSDQLKAAWFYQSGMDTVTIEKKGISPLQGFLDDIGKIESTGQLQRYMEGVAPYGGGGFFGVFVYPDLQDNRLNVGCLGGASLGLPDRDYYVKDDEETLELLNKYKQHVAVMMGFLDYSEAEATNAADRIISLEKRLAEPMLTKIQKRNPSLMYNKRSVGELQKMASTFEWSKYFSNAGIMLEDSIIVSELKYIESLDDILSAVDLEDVREYLRFLAINEAAPYLHGEVEAAHFAFYGTVMNGTETMKPRWERVLDMSNNMVGEALGKLYVDAYFPPVAKQRAEEMVGNILEAFGDRIDQVDWMSDTTKGMAHKKLVTFTVKIGYPDKWEDFSNLAVKSPEDGTSYFENVMAGMKFQWEKNLKKIGKEVDRDEWFMPPQMVNAYYNPLFNEIVFPAAILQPPFYNYEADAAVNYGGIGAVIGHEISHGFDDQGSQFDANGNLSNWWTDKDRERFEERNKKLIEQFDAYEPFPGIHVNGEFTLGENIGDLGGVNVAYDGLQIHFKKHGKPDPIDGYTAEQRFFISWGTIWRTKYRDEALKTQIKTDPHSPGMYRATGPLVNVSGFYDAFNIVEGDSLYKSPEERVMIW
jgi:putative endopeptidase